MVIKNIEYSVFDNDIVDNDIVLLLHARKQESRLGANTDLQCFLAQESDQLHYLFSLDLDSALNVYQPCIINLSQFQWILELRKFRDQLINVGISKAWLTGTILICSILHISILSSFSHLQLCNCSLSACKLQKSRIQTKIKLKQKCCPRRLNLVPGHTPTSYTKYYLMFCQTYFHNSDPATSRLF